MDVSVQVRFTNAISEAEDSLTRQITKEIKLLQLAEGKCSNIYLQSQYDYLQKLKSKYKLKVNCFFFITLNFMDDIPLPIIIDVTKKIKVRKYFKDLIYCFDQRGDTVETMGKGIHVHSILCKTSPEQQVKSIINWLYNSCKKYMGSKAAVDVRQYPMEFYEDKISYLKGDKDKLEKQACAEITAQWRLLNNLEDIYE